MILSWTGSDRAGGFHGSAVTPLLTQWLIDNDQRAATTPSLIHDGRTVGSVGPGADEESITAEEELRSRLQQVAQRGPSDTQSGVDGRIM